MFERKRMLVAFLLLGLVLGRENLLSAPGEGKQLIKLAAKIQSQRYCEGDAEVSMLNLTLRLKFTNIGGERVLLLRERNKAAAILISHTAEEASAKRYEHEIIPDDLTEGQTKSFRSLSQDGNFVLLKPGDSYETDSTLSFAVPRTSREPRPHGTVGPGKHTLQIQIYTWPDTEASAEKLRRRWRKTGLLYSGFVTSDPVELQVRTDSKVENCGKTP